MSHFLIQDICLSRTQICSSLGNAQNKSLFVHSQRVSIQWRLLLSQVAACSKSKLGNTLQGVSGRYPNLLFSSFTSQEKYRRTATQKLGVSRERFSKMTLFDSVTLSWTCGKPDLSAHVQTTYKYNCLKRSNTLAATYFTVVVDRICITVNVVMCNKKRLNYTKSTTCEVIFTTVFVFYVQEKQNPSDATKME